MNGFLSLFIKSDTCVQYMHIVAIDNIMYIQLFVLQLVQVRW
jgi:hypothetical protein